MTQLKSLLYKIMRNTSTYMALFCGWLIVAMILIVVYEVWQRFVAQDPVGWAVEIPRLMFLVIVFMGLAYATRTGGHVSLDILTTRLPRRAHGLLKVITSFLALIVSAVLLWQSIRIIVDAINQQWFTSTIPRVLEWPFYVFMVFGLFIMCLEWIGQMVVGWHGFKHPTETKPERGT